MIIQYILYVLFTSVWVNVTDLVKRLFPILPTSEKKRMVEGVNSSPLFLLLLRLFKNFLLITWKIATPIEGGKTELWYHSHLISQWIFSIQKNFRVLTERDNLNFLTKNERERLHCETTSNFLKMKLRSTYPEVQRLLQKDFPTFQEIDRKKPAIKFC